MKDDRQIMEALGKIGVLAGVGEEWYEIGEPEYDAVADGHTRYGVYAKTDDIAEKVRAVMDALFEHECAKE